MRHHSTVGLVTNSSSETFTIQATDLAKNVKEAFDSLLKALDVDMETNDVTVTVTGHSDWLYDVANEVFAEMMGECPELFTDDIRTKQYIDGEYQLAPRKGEWSRSEWEDVDEDTPLYKEFLRRYELVQGDYVEISKDYSGPATIVSDIQIKAGDKVIDLDDLPGMSQFIAKGLY